MLTRVGALVLEFGAARTEHRRAATSWPLPVGVRLLLLGVLLGLTLGITLARPAEPQGIVVISWVWMAGIVLGGRFDDLLRRRPPANRDGRHP